MVVEPKQRVRRPTLLVILLEVGLLLRVCSVVWLRANKKYDQVSTVQVSIVESLHGAVGRESRGCFRLLTFFRGLPRPRPLVGGARTSPSGPLECFYLMCV